MIPSAPGNARRLKYIPQTPGSRTMIGRLATLTPKEVTVAEKSVYTHRVLNSEGHQGWRMVGWGLCCNMDACISIGSRVGCCNVAMLQGQNKRARLPKRTPGLGIKTGLRLLLQSAAVSTRQRALFVSC